MIHKIVTAICCVYLLFPSIGCREGFSREKMIEAALAAAMREGFEVRGKHILYDNGNELWIDTQAVLSQVSPAKDVRLSKIAGRNYQAIHFRPDDISTTRGGGVWVFVDRSTGKVITVYGEE